ncbi:MAG TPA: alpha/beta fold hydrolase [Albitalea sp.]|nr:alpha/beta fold hydrolase [Albitalea sp.]
MKMTSQCLAKWLGVSLLAVLATIAGSALAAPPPIEDYTKWPAIDDVVVSPSGKRMAVLVFGSDGRRKVGVMDLDPIGKPRVVGGFWDADVEGVHWVSDDRLVYSASERGAVIYDGKAGTFAVNHDGSEPRKLISWAETGGEIPGTRIVSKVLPYGWYLHSTIDDGSNEVFVYKRVGDSVGDFKQIVLARLNTSTGALRNLSFGMPDGTSKWILDAKHEPRMLVAHREGREKVYWRAPAADSWSEVADFDPLLSGFNPWFVDRDGQLLVTARYGTEGLYRFDPIAKRVEPDPLVSVTGFDLNAQKVVDTQTGRLMGLHFVADRPMSYWFDAGLQRIQKGVDGALPGRSNRLYCGRCESTRFIVVRSSSDREPGEYFLFDRSKASLESIGASRPWIVEAQQGRRSFHRVNARDGLTLPVYVTHPAGSADDQPLPGVVLVHGGPWLRGSDLSWDAEAQFLASRGYRVIEPEFRGSEGYGAKLFKAGWKEWGRAMQDDLVDALQWAVKQRLVDPARVCIVGASYGGYAALMGPIAHPGVYRCAASFAGVTDIDLKYSVTWSDTSEAYRRYGMPVLIGDRIKDAELLARASPLKRVAEIKIPVLLAHGGADRRVPIVHARKFIGAARSAGVNIEELIYPEEGHGFFDPANHADYYGHLERFLEKSLRPPN